MSPELNNANIKSRYVELANEYLYKIPTNNLEDFDNIKAALTILLNEDRVEAKDDDLKGRIESIKEMIDHPELYALPENQELFKTVIRDQIAAKIRQISSLKPSEKNERIQEAQIAEKQAEKNRAKIQKAERPKVGSEKHVMSNEEWLSKQRTEYLEKDLPADWWNGYIDWLDRESDQLMIEGVSEEWLDDFRSTLVVQRQERYLKEVPSDETEERLAISRWGILDDEGLINMHKLRKTASSEIFQLINGNQQEIKALLSAGASVADLSSLNPANLAKIIFNSNRFTYLKEEAKLDYSKIMSLKEDMIYLVLVHCQPIAELSHKKLSLDTLLKLTENQLLDVFRNSENVIKLLDAGLDFSEIEQKLRSGQKVIDLMIQ